jgi:hypothetical protein
MFANFPQFLNFTHSQLPLENWADLLAFVPRHQLVEIVGQIGDRHFARALQFCLHKIGKVFLGGLRIFPPRKKDGQNGRPFVKLWRKHFGWGQQKLALADLPMPENVKWFKSIYLRFALLF